ncbi:hypothetical protein ACHAWX_002038 [Stephanocyclus meneghinianus]
MDELLASWLGSDTIYENIMRIIETQKQESTTNKDGGNASASAVEDGRPPLSPKMVKKIPKKVEIPSFFAKPKDAEGNPQIPPPQPPKRRWSSSFTEDQTWNGVYMALTNEGRENESPKSLEQDSVATDPTAVSQKKKVCIAIQAKEIFTELGTAPPIRVADSQQQQLGGALRRYYLQNTKDEYHTSEEDLIYIPLERFERVTKELCNFPTFFHKPLYERILMLWSTHYHLNVTGGGGDGVQLPPVVTYGIFHYYWKKEMAPYDKNERFFRLLKRPDVEYITRDDFFPYIKELLNDHPGLEFLSNHAEFQDKYAVTVITRIFYSVNLCHSGRITSRQIRKSNLLSVFQQVDEEEDINKVTKYFSYEHFYVLYCRFWELDHDRDYKITREDLLKYGEHSLSHMIVDRIFDAAPRPFEGSDPATVDENGNVVAKVSRNYLSYEDFIFFMLSEEDKANEFSVRYWFTCIDVDGDDKLNNMEMRAFYAVQLHRMQCMGHEVVPFEDMLCQMMDMIKPANTEYLVVEDFLQPHCSQVSGALFDALFNVNKYVMFEQRDPFLERQKREDEFETDWDRFACIDYNRLAMEEEAREEEAMEVDWVTMDEEEEDADEYNSLGLSGSSEAPF